MPLTIQLTFVYALFISLGVFIIGLAAYSYLFARKIKKVTVNPINIIAGAIFLMALWLFDLSTLGISEHGISNPLSTYNVVPGGVARLPGVYLWGFVFFGMAIVALYYFFYNEKHQRGSVKTFHRFLIGSLFLGLTIAFSGALYMLIMGYKSAIFGIIYAEGFYHSSLPLLIIPVLALMIDTK